MFQFVWCVITIQQLDSNRRPLVLEVTALPTEAQPLPYQSKCLLRLPSCLLCLVQSLSICELILIKLLKMGQSRPLFCLFSFFSSYNFNNTNCKSIGGVLGICTRDRRMVAADKTTELWRPSILLKLLHNQCFKLQVPSHSVWPDVKIIFQYLADYNNEN